MSSDVAERRAYLEMAIADICEQMKGSLSNVERALLHADRQDFRTELDELDDSV